MRTHTQRDQRGFSLIELLIVIGLMGILAAIGIVVSPAYMRSARAEASLMQTLGVLRSAREVAITQRRNVQVRFAGADTIETARVEVPSGSTTVLQTVQLGNQVEFRLPSGVPDTPDRFGNAAAVAFGPSPTRMFTAEGSFVDANGDLLNGTLFLSSSGDNNLRAVTVFGATGVVHAWQWNGNRWLE